MAAQNSEASPQKHLAEAVKRFSRSIELCEDYLRGYYGLKLVRGSVTYLCTAGRLTEMNRLRIGC
jgi:hypothetical protein